jgi:hypothetical protein
MQLRTEVEIEASPDRVWAVLTDFGTYPEWNPFIVRAAGQLARGARLDITLSLPESNREMQFRPEVVVCEPGRELRWRGRLFVPGLFDGEHFFELREPTQGRTRVVHGENFSGILLKFMGQTLTQTTRGFVYMNQALKRRVEQGAGPAGRPPEPGSEGPAAR